ncbi:MAG: hypothetical protein HFJ34_02405 [Clostridia bacterium]|nr:hypothetical protein [Clostridia bacterium]
MKKIKILTITLLMVAVTMIAFLGIYTQKQNRMENLVKDYEWGMDLKGSRNIRLKLNTESKTVIKDAEGKEVEDTENLTDEQLIEKGYHKEEIPNNSEDVKTLENYKTAKKIIEKRLEKLGVNNYQISLDEQTGDMVIDLPENGATDSIISNLYTVGKFEIIDSQTKEVLMNNNDVKQARVMYGGGENGTTIYLEIEFEKEGAKKLEEISNQYQTTQNSETEENTTTDSNTTQENATENTDTTSTEKKITMNIDDTEIMSTSFEEPVRTGRLQLSFGSSSTDAKTIQQSANQASSMATVLDTGNIPVKYALDENQYIFSDITKNEMEIAVYVILAIMVLGLIVLFIKYKKLGALGVISYIGFVSFMLIIIRYANVTLSIEGVFGIAITFVLNYILVYGLLAKIEERKEVYKDFFIKMIPIMIMVITFCFINWLPISSFGMVMFWGIALIALYNSILTNSLLKIETRKEK